MPGSWETFSGTLSGNNYETFIFFDGFWAVPGTGHHNVTFWDFPSELSWQIEKILIDSTCMFQLNEAISAITSM